MNTPKLLYVPILVLIALILTGCGPSAEQLTATAQSAKMMTLTAAPTSTLLPTFTPTSTPTVTPSSTPTETPTITPSPTPDRVVVGDYPVGGCGSANMSQGGQLKFCVTGVTVNINRHLIFSVTWKLSNLPGGFSVSKRSDEGNRKMYLTDNLGNRYDHVAGGGAAYTSVGVGDGVPVSGWFDFGSSAIGAFTFAFHDDDNGILIGGMFLYPGSSPTISYENLLLDPYPLLLAYQKEIWDIAKGEDGTSKLMDKNMSACTVQAQATHKPKGDFKSQTPVGKITYDIYGYFDDNTKLYVREYIYVSGISGMDASTKPFFYVTIPADSSEGCILDASNLLSGLAPQKP